MKALTKQPKKAKAAHPKAAITFRRNVLPPLLGVLMFFATLGILNGQWITAQVQYYLVPLHPTSITSVSNLQLDPNAPARIMIPSVGINDPFITSETSYDENRVQLALRSGIVHFGTTALPGQVGNVVAIGHSSGQLWSPGHYKYAFTLLNKVPVNGLVYIDYQGTRYIYRVTSREVVEPDDINVLNQTNTPELTLITCTPVGVSSHRLVLHAKQISPSPKTATNSNTTAQPVTAIKLPQ